MVQPGISVDPAGTVHASGQVTPVSGSGTVTGGSLQLEWLSSAPDGWTPVECHVPGGRDAAAHVLASLVGAGVAVAGFDRVELSLADLIERIVASRALATAGA